jgi:hypothetical protein
VLLRPRHTCLSPRAVGGVAGCSARWKCLRSLSTLQDASLVGFANYRWSRRRPPRAPLQSKRAASSPMHTPYARRQTPAHVPPPSRSPCPRRSMFRTAAGSTVYLGHSARSEGPNRMLVARVQHASRASTSLVRRSSLHVTSFWPYQPTTRDRFQAASPGAHFIHQYRRLLPDVQHPFLPCPFPRSVCIAPCV